MLTLAVDRPASVAVWWFSGPSNSDADYQRYIATLGEMREQARVNGVGTGVLVATRDNPPPSATWRRRMAEASHDFPPHCVFAMVSESVVVRGVVTAINWIRPPTYEVVAVSSVEEALAWLRPRRDGPTIAAVERCLTLAKSDAAR